MKRDEKKVFHMKVAVWEWEVNWIELAEEWNWIFSLFTTWFFSSFISAHIMKKKEWFFGVAVAKKSEESFLIEVIVELLHEKLILNFLLG